MSDKTTVMLVKEIPKADVSQALRVLRADPEIRYVEVRDTEYNADDYRSSSVTIGKEAPENAFRVPLKLEKSALSEGPLGMYCAWSLTSSVDGEVYKDLQGDTISDEEIEKSYMRTHGQLVPLYKNHDLSDRTVVGTVAFFPMTADVKKGLGLTSSKCGMLSVMHITDGDVRKSISAGELPDVSIEAKGQRS